LNVVQEKHLAMRLPQFKRSPDRAPENPWLIQSQSRFASA
jgi:hypothetical protein